MDDGIRSPLDLRRPFAAGRAPRPEGWLRRFERLVRRCAGPAQALPLAFVAAGCVPPGNSQGGDAGSTTVAPAPSFRPSMNVMTAVFEDRFERSSTPAARDSDAEPKASGDAALADAKAAEGGTTPRGLIADPNVDLPEFAGLGLRRDKARDAEPATPDLGPDWTALGPAWRIEGGKLCGERARNRGVWLKRVLPVNARIEFDAISYADEGDLKAEVWGDGRSGATGVSYTNASSYLAILGGWKNSLHVLARLNEHGADRKEIPVDPTSDDPRQRPVAKGQVYRFRIERADGKTVRWFVDDVEFLTYTDTAPLAGAGHDHFGFNNWEVKVCFDNVKVTPLGS